MNAHEPATVERLSPQDLTQLACDVGPAPMQVAGILILDATDGLRPSTVVEAIADRIDRVPRLRQRLLRTALGYGRPIWVDDPRFDIRQHVHCVHCPAPGDEHALLTVAAAAATRRLPTDRPLWSMTVVTGLADGRTGLIIVMHHVVADGLAGLAVLTSLVDGAAPAPHRRPPRPPPSRRRLLANAARARLRTIAALPGTLRRLRAAAARLRPVGTAPAPACSLNQPTGERRMLAIARIDLAAARTVAYAHGATVNDVLLAAVSGALRSLLRDRGEIADRLVVSVPASARRTADATSLGNEVGVIPVSLPIAGDPSERLKTITGITRRRKEAPPAASNALLGPVFRALARVGLFAWFINHQRQVNTFVTNMRGPEVGLTFLSTPITGIYPVTVVPGNVTIAFAALSYAGTLNTTIIADPDRCPDLPALARYVQREFDTLASASCGG